MTFLLESTLKSSLILGFALAVVTGLRGRSAALRHWILATAIVCAATAPALALLVPAWHPPFDLAAAVRGSRPGQAHPVSGAPASPAPAEAQTRVAIAQPEGEVQGARLASLIGPIWIAGACISLAVLFVGLARLSWLAAGARQSASRTWTETATGVAREYGVRRRALLLQSDHPSLLVTWGFWRPKIILPRAAHDWSEERVRIVLWHELAHIRRGDWVVQVAAEVLRSVYWFNPLLWVACTRLREESERACDDVVMSRGIEGPEYAAQLLDLARALNAQRHLWFAAPAMARASSLERRVAAMLNARINRNPIARSARVVTFAALVALALAVAGFNASAQATFASFSGSVVDQLGGTVPGATLTVSNNQTGQKYQVRSNAVGSFEFVGLTAGEYELRTELPGFRAANGRFTVAGRNVRQDIALRVASIQETITVVDRGEPRADASQARVRRGPAPKGAPCVAVPAGGHIAPPTKTVDVKPIYPRNLEGAKVDGGVVVLDALIGTDGSIQDVRPVDPAVQPELASAAMEAVRLWRFTPTLLNCVPIEVSMNVTVNFKAE